jgi:penicillin amidase
MPESAGFGDSYMPAVQRPSFGASQRLIVQPGNEENGILTIPGGQSGHPLSVFFKTGYSEFVENEAQRFLPEEVQHTLVFEVE